MSDLPKEIVIVLIPALVSAIASILAFISSIAMILSQRRNSRDLELLKNDFVISLDRRRNRIEIDKNRIEHIARSVEIIQVCKDSLNDLAWAPGGRIDIAAICDKLQGARSAIEGQYQRHIANDNSDYMKDIHKAKNAISHISAKFARLSISNKSDYLLCEDDIFEVKSIRDDLSETQIRLRSELNKVTSKIAEY